MQIELHSPHSVRKDQKELLSSTNFNSVQIVRPLPPLAMKNEPNFLSEIMIFEVYSCENCFSAFVFLRRVKKCCCSCKIIKKKKGKKGT